MNITSEKYECKRASIQELETSPCLERKYWSLGGNIGYYIVYQDATVELITDVFHAGANNRFKSVLDIDVSKVDYWTILDTPQPAKIDLYGKRVIPGLLMTITKDGNDAILVFFPMALCCMWSKDPLSQFYDKDFVSSWYFYDHFNGKNRFLWKERPFSQILSLFSKGKKISFMRVNYRLSDYDPMIVNDYIHVW